MHCKKEYAQSCLQPASLLALDLTSNTSGNLPVCRYAGYPLLLQAIALPEDGGQGAASQQHFLSAEAAPQLQVRSASAAAVKRV